MSFRSLISNVTGIDPLTRAFTLAGVSLEIFKTKSLQENEVGVTPANSYHLPRQYSAEAAALFDYVEDAFNVSLKREVKIGKFYVDALLTAENKDQKDIIFEFFGCFFHGCPKCYSEQLKKQTSTKSLLAQRHANTLKRISYFTEKLNYSLVIIWGCELAKLLEKESMSHLRQYIQERKKFYKFIKHSGGVDVRKSYKGGRTNCIRFLCETEIDQKNNCRERIAYKDIISLYPHCLRNRVYPLSHPILIDRNIDLKKVDQFFGFMFVKILCPNRCYLPLLHYTVDGKLLFPACRTCAENATLVCNHSRSERALIGTYTTVEIGEALSMGYELMEVYQVLRYKQKSDHLFKDYVDTWIKLKAEASGYPSDCITDAQKAAFVDDFKQHENVELDPSKIENNAGLRFISKSILNSLYGKLAQKPNLCQSELVTSVEAYFDLVDRSDIAIIGEKMLTDNILLVTYQQLEEDDRAVSNNTALALASFCTAYGRIELQKILNSIESQSEGAVLYFDTDSVVYHEKAVTSNEGEVKWIPHVPTSCYLGSLSDEILKISPEAVCFRFIACGPKNYAIQVLVPKDLNEKQIITIVKIKGIKLSYAALLDLTKHRDRELNTTDNLSGKSLKESTFNQMHLCSQSLIDSGGKKILEFPVRQMQIRPDGNLQIFTNLIQKNFRVCASKRALVDGKNLTLPFGYYYNNSSLQIK